MGDITGVVGFEPNNTPNGELNNNQGDRMGTNMDGQKWSKQRGIVTKINIFFSLSNKKRFEENVKKRYIPGQSMSHCEISSELAGYSDQRIE